jgi:hypothetical protein
VICKAASQSPKPQMTPAMWDTLQRLARDMGGRGQHPLTNLNEQEGVELDLDRRPSGFCLWCDVIGSYLP